MVDLQEITELPPVPDRPNPVTQRIIRNRDRRWWLLDHDRSAGDLRSGGISRRCGSGQVRNLEPTVARSDWN